MAFSSPPGMFINNLFKTIWSEQDGDLPFPHNIQRFYKLYIY